MKDYKDRLKNRSNLERLEQDLEVIERLVAKDAVGEKIKKLASQARRDLEAARSAHIELLLKLQSSLPLERQAARQEVEQRIAAGETSLFDPHTRHWRPAVDVLNEALAFDERMQQREAEIHQIEAQLADSARISQNLYQARLVIQRAEELLSQGVLSEAGKKALSGAREVFESGCTAHRNVTLNFHNGTLKERFDALGKLRDLIANGAAWILDTPDDVWRPADQVLEAAEQSCVAESARLSNEAIHQADLLAETNLQAALRDLYLAMDLTIPYVDTDRSRLKVKYTEMLEVHRQREREAPILQDGEDRISAEDLAGFIAVRALNQQRLRKLALAMSQWFYKFFDSALTRPVTNLLIEAEDENTLPARTVELIDMAVSLAKDAMEGSIEIPEVMFRGALILFTKGIQNRDREFLTAALPLYTLDRPDKIHRHAVSAWLLGCIEFLAGHRLPGYSNWKTAQRLFDKLYILATKEKDQEKADWYYERLLELSGYELQTFEEIYLEWMNKFDDINMPQSSREFRDILDRQLGADQIILLRNTLRQYLDASKTQPMLEIQWTALVDAAFYSYEIKKYISALAYLNQAWVGYQYSHRGAVVLWLSGLIQWWFPSKTNAAVKNWQTSIRIFQNLSHEADQKNENSKHNWYDTQIELMSSALKDWIQRTAGV